MAWVFGRLQPCIPVWIYAAPFTGQSTSENLFYSWCISGVCPLEKKELALLAYVAILVYYDLDCSNHFGLFR